MALSSETRTEVQVRLLLERKCRRLADLVRTELPPGEGFALFLFDFGEKGNCAYVSSGDRKDDLAALPPGALDALNETRSTLAQFHARRGPRAAGATP